MQARDSPSGTHGPTLFLIFGDNMTIRFTKLASQLAVASSLLAFAGMAVAADPIKIGVTGPFTADGGKMMIP